MFEIKITCDGSEYFDIDDFCELQGELKSLSEDSYNRLKKSILEFGFSFPVFYSLIDDKKYIIDNFIDMYKRQYPIVLK